MRLLTVVCVVAALVVGCIVIFPWALDVANQERDEANQWLADRVSIGNMVAAARAEIQRERNGLSQPLTEILLAKQSLTTIANERDSLKRQIAEHDAAIVRGMTILDESTGSTVPVKGKALPRERVQADVDRRAVVCEDLRIRLASAKTRHTELDAGIKEGLDSIKQSQADLDAAEEELDHMVVQLEADAATEKVRTLIANFKGATVDLGENRHLAQVRRRSTEYVAKRELRGFSSVGSEYLDYDGLAALSSASPAEAYRAKYLTNPDSVSDSVSADDPVTDEDGFLDLGSAEDSAS